MTPAASARPSTAISSRAPALLAAGLVVLGVPVVAGADMTEGARGGAASGAERGGTLRDGRSAWSIGSCDPGDIEIEGSVLRGPAHGGAFEGYHRFTIEGTTIAWGKPLGGITLAGTIVGTVAMGDPDGVLAGFYVVVRNAESGNLQTVSCAVS